MQQKVGTVRRTQCVNLMLEGFSNKEIGYRMGITRDSVKQYLQLAGIHNRCEAMAHRIKELERIIEDLKGIASPTD